MTQRRQRLRDRLRTLPGAWPAVIIVALVAAVAFAPLDWLMGITIAALAFVALGCAVFITVYRPLWPWRHDVYGRNLLMLCWWLLIWIVAAFVQLVVPMPFRVAVGLQLVAVAGIGTVIWDRVFLVPRARREVRAEQERG